jgi:hypothetical protein
MSGLTLFPRRILPDGRILDLLPLTFGRARIAIGDGGLIYDDFW